MTEYVSLLPAHMAEREFDQLTTRIDVQAARRLRGDRWGKVLRLSAETLHAEDA